MEVEVDVDVEVSSMLLILLVLKPSIELVSFTLLHPCMVFASKLSCSVVRERLCMWDF